MKRVLVVSDVWPCSDLTAGLALSKLIASISEMAEVHTFVFIDRSLTKHKPKTEHSVTNFFTFKPNENWTGGRPIRLILEPFIKFFTLREVDGVAEDLTLVFNQVRPDHVLMVLQGQTSYLLSKFVLDFKVPFTTLTWDPWEWWCSTHSVGPNLDLLVQESHQCIYNVGTHLVPTLKFAQANSIEESRSRIVYFPEFEASPSSRMKKSEEQINIVFSGQNYASHEISQFIDALRGMNWNMNGKQILFHIVGCTIQVRDKNVIQHGWIDNKFLPNFLRDFDIAFLPYPTKENLLSVAQQSFPSKLSTYLSASLPVIYLGPQSASVLEVAGNVTFVVNNDGENLTNLEEIIQEIDDRYVELALEANRLFHSKFSFKAFNLNIHSWGNSVGLNRDSEYKNESSDPISIDASYRRVTKHFQGTFLIRKIQLFFSRALITKLKSTFIRLILLLRARSLVFGFAVYVRLGESIANLYVTIFKLRNSRK